MYPSKAFSTSKSYEDFQEYIANLTDVNDSHVPKNLWEYLPDSLSLPNDATFSPFLDADVRPIEHSHPASNSKKTDISCADTASSSATRNIVSDAQTYEPTESGLRKCLHDAGFSCNSPINAMNVATRICSLGVTNETLIAAVKIANDLNHPTMTSLRASSTDRYNILHSILQIFNYRGPNLKIWQAIFHSNNNPNTLISNLIAARAYI